MPERIRPLRLSLELSRITVRLYNVRCSHLLTKQHALRSRFKLSPIKETRSRRETPSSSLKGSRGAGQARRGQAQSPGRRAHSQIQQWTQRAKTYSPKRTPRGHLLSPPPVDWLPTTPERP